MIFDVICIQECHISELSDISLLDIPGYICIEQGSSCSRKGGLVIYLKECYNYKKILTNAMQNIWESQFIQIKGEGLLKSVIIGNIYKPPRELITDYKAFTSNFADTINKINRNDDELIIAGDYNINLLNINSREVINEFFTCFISISLIPKITFPTRFSARKGTLIDNFLCRISEKIISAKAGILIDKLSDHQPYFLILDIIRQPKHKPKMVTILKIIPDAIDKIIRT